MGTVLMGVLILLAKELIGMGPVLFKKLTSCCRKDLSGPSFAKRDLAALLLEARKLSPGALWCALGTGGPAAMSCDPHHGARFWHTFVTTYQ